MAILTCEICGKSYNNANGSFVNHLIREHDMTAQEYYDKFLKKDKSEGICPVCGKPTKFYNLNGYAKHCSKKCNQNSSETKAKREATNLERYGVENPWQADEVKKKIKQTNLERYGVQSPLQSEEIKNKVKNTCLNKYGVDHVWKSKECREKQYTTCEERYGDRYYHNIEKAQKTCLKRYGVKNPNQSKKIREKTELTCLKKYGTRLAVQSEEVKNKIKQTNLEKYGGVAPACSSEVIEKMQQTCEEKYGVTHISKLDNFSDKCKQTCIERYGNPTYNNIEKARETIRNNNSYGLSKPEERTFKKLVEIFENVDREHREDRYPFSCDFYIPERDMFIEYNGFWTHNTHFYDEASEEDRNQVKLWESKRENSSWYEAAINNWTISDVKKRNTARENNLNYVVFWNENDVDKWIADSCPDRQDWR